MLSFFTSLFGLFSRSGAITKALDLIDKRIDAGTQRDLAKLDLLKTYAAQQAELMRGPTFWMALVFVAPLGLWFAGVCLYSLLWCKGCAYPQDWTIAALPPPLDEWSGAIIATLFGGGFAVQAVARFRK